MSEREAFISNLMREDIARIMYSFKPLLVGDGNKEEEVDQWIEVCRSVLTFLCSGTYAPLAIELREGVKGASNMWPYQMAIYSGH